METTLGWRHFRCIQVRKAGPGATFLLLQASCDASAQLWVNSQVGRLAGGRAHVRRRAAGLAPTAPARAAGSRPAAEQAQPSAPTPAAPPSPSPHPPPQNLKDRQRWAAGWLQMSEILGQAEGAVGAGRPCRACAGLGAKVCAGCDGTGVVRLVVL
jgi:hypothetical protein